MSSTLELVAMTEAQYAAWLAASTPAYAAAHVADGKWSADEALARARAEIESLLPSGLATPGHRFDCLMRGDECVGQLWVAEVEEGGRRGLYIYDLEVAPSARRQGVARDALRRVEARARAAGLAFVGLHVFGSNAGARSLYLSEGFVETNVRMRKSLEPLE